MRRRYSLFLSELSSSAASPLAARATVIVANFKHEDPPPHGADALSHPDTVALRAAIAELTSAAGRSKPAEPKRA